MKVEAIRPLKSLLEGSELEQYCFCRILLAKASHKARPVQGGEKYAQPRDGRHNICIQRWEEFLAASLQTIYHTPYSAH